MSTPFDYNPDYNFTAFQAENPTTPLPADELDAQLQEISQSVNQIAQSEFLLQDGDGNLLPGVVGASALAPGLNLGINSFAPWVANTLYALQAGVIYNNAIYVCIVKHTSSISFPNDLVAGDWQLIIDFKQFLIGQIASLIPVVSFRNGFLNGTAQIAQRGTAFNNVGTSVVQTVDGWTAWKGGAVNGMNVLQESGAATADGVFYKNLLRVQRTAANTDLNLMTIANIIPSSDMPRYAGKTVTLSFVARAGANFTSFNGGPNPQFVTGTGTDEGSAVLKAGTWAGAALPFSLTQPLTTTLTRYSYTFSIAANAKEGAFQIANFPTGTAGANDYFEIGGLQLEVGSQATPYEDLAFEDELLRCLPFFCKSFEYAVAPVQNLGNNASCVAIVSQAANAVGRDVQFPRPMYKVPVVTTYNPSAANANWRDNSNSADRAANVIRTSSKNVGIYTSVNTVAGSENLIHWSAEGGL